MAFKENKLAISLRAGRSPISPGTFSCDHLTRSHRYNTPQKETSREKVRA